MHARSGCSRRVVWILACAGLCCALLAALWVYMPSVFPWDSQEKQAVASMRRAGIPVRAQRAILRDFPVYFFGLGNVVATNTVTVRSRVDGHLMRLHFTEGQQVEAGALLAQVDPRPYEIQLAQAEAQLARDQALLKNAQKDLARYKVLLPQDSASQQQVDTQESLVRQYEAAIKTDQASIDSAKLQLTYCSITAPVSGRLGLRLVDEGTLMRGSDATGIVVITQVQPISVVFTVTETQLPSVLQAMREGSALDVEAWDRTQSHLLATGKLLTTDNQIDTATGTVKLKAIFSNTDNSLFPNQFVNARIRVGILSQAVLAPSAAIQKGNSGFYVYAVAEGNKVVQRPVRTGLTDDTRTVVTEGVEAGDLLVIDGLDRLRDGVLVDVAPEGDRRRGNGTDGGRRGGRPGARAQ